MTIRRQIPSRTKTPARSDSHGREFASCQRTTTTSTIPSTSMAVSVLRCATPRHAGQRNHASQYTSKPVSISVTTSASRSVNNPAGMPLHARQSTQANTVRRALGSLPTGPFLCESRLCALTGSPCQGRRIHSTGILSGLALPVPAGLWHYSPCSPLSAFL